MEKTKYKVIKPIGYYGRREIGEIVELTDDEAKAFGKDYLEPVIGAATAAEGKVETGSAVKPRKRAKKSENQ